MARLRNGTADLLVATDVAARGLDIDQLTHVVNYDVPVRAGVLRRTGSAASAAPGARASRSRWPSRASTGCSRRSSASPSQKITIEKVPTVADLRARRLELTRAALRGDACVEDDLDRFRVVVETLADEYDVDGDRAGRGQARARGRRRRPTTTRRRSPRSPRATGARAPRDRAAAPQASRRDPAHDAAVRRRRPRPRRPPAGPRRRDRRRVRRQRAATIGAIEISDRFSLVEVPESARRRGHRRPARARRSRARRPTVRRDRTGPPPQRKRR